MYGSSGFRIEINSILFSCFLVLENRDVMNVLSFSHRTNSSGLTY